MKGRTLAVLAALGAATAGAVVLYKKKKAEEEQLILDFDLTQDDASDAAEAVKAAETAEATGNIAEEEPDAETDNIPEPEQADAAEESDEAILPESDD